MPFQYKKVAVIGATSGIGQAFAERFIAEGSFVIAIGRRKDRLEALVQGHGSDQAQAESLDITNLESIPTCVTNLIKTHPDLDCVLLASGMQRKCDFSDPVSVDIESIQTELLTNYTAQLALTKALLPFLMAKKSPCALVYISSGLAMVPSVGVSNYCATKAALHSWCLCLREQLSDTDVKIIEIFTPAVQTELHDVNPDIKDGRAMGMPLAEFINVAYDGLQSGSEQVPVGTAKGPINAFELKRQETIRQDGAGPEGERVKHWCIDRHSVCTWLHASGA